MTSNHRLKDDCKHNLDAIRAALPPNEQQQVEPYLRNILSVTKALMGNVKVKPEEHQAMIQEIDRLKGERRDQSALIAQVRSDSERHLEQVARLKAKVIELESHGNLQAEFATEIAATSAYAAVMTLLVVIEKYGDYRIAEWFTGKVPVAMSSPMRSLECRTLLAMWQVIATVLPSNNDVVTVVKELSDHLSSTA